MPNDRVYRIIISNNTDDAKVASKAGGAGGIQNQTQNNGNGGEEKKKASAKSAFKKVMVYQGLKSVANNQISYQVSKVQLVTGSSDAQAKANLWYNMAQKGVSFAESVVMGTLLGGGVGAAIGAVVGVVNMAIDAQQSYNDYNLGKKLEKTQRDLSTQRETVSGSRYQGATQI